MFLYVYAIHLIYAFMLKKDKIQIHSYFSLKEIFLT